MGRGRGSAGKIPASQHFQVRQDHAESSTGPQVGKGVSKRSLAVGQSQVLQYMAAIQPRARSFRNREPSHNVSITHIRRKPAFVLRVKTSNEWNALKSKRWAGVEIQPGF